MSDTLKFPNRDRPIPKSAAADCGVWRPWNEGHDAHRTEREGFQIHIRGLVGRFHADEPDPQDNYYAVSMYVEVVLKSRFTGSFRVQ